MLRCLGPTGRKQTVPEFIAVGVTTLKHCLRFLSRLADGIDNLQCGKVNPTKKMIDPKLTKYLEEIWQTVKFKKWFFGHYHDNKNVNAEELLLYEQIIRIA